MMDLHLAIFVTFLFLIAAVSNDARGQSASMVGSEIKQMRMAERLATARAQHRLVMRRLGARCN